MINTNLLKNSNVREVTQTMGDFSIVEYSREISIRPDQAIQSYFASKMNIRKKQLVADLHDTGIVCQSGAMQMMIGDIQAGSNIHGVGDLAKKWVGGKMTGESVVKPRYAGTGQVVLEPTYKYIILEDLDDWNGGIIVQEGMFLACDDEVQLKVTARKSVSSMVLGKEGMFNLSLRGTGIVALESPVPQEELLVVDLEDDVLKVDGNMVLAWSTTLKFTVEKTTKTLAGSAATGEGLVNTYRGTGRVILAPVEDNAHMAAKYVNGEPPEDGPVEADEYDR